MTEEIYYKRSKSFPALTSRKSPILGIVGHFTGSGVFKRFIRSPSKWKDPFYTANHVYSDIYKYCPHVTIGNTIDAIGVFGDYKVVTRHVGSENWKKYVMQRQAMGLTFIEKLPLWWSEKWSSKGIFSPACFMQTAWNYPLHSINEASIGFEITPSNPEITGKYSVVTQGALWRAYRWCKGNCRALSIPFDEKCIVAHCDIDPLGRTSKHNTPYDFFESQWSFDLMCEKYNVVESQLKKKSADYISVVTR